MGLELATMALLIAGYALIAARLDRVSVGPALAFIVIGLLLSDEGFGWISIEPEAEPVKVLAEATLTLLLFADASTIHLHALREDAAVVGRLLVVGLLLTIALGAVMAGVLFPGVEAGVALLIGAALAPDGCGPGTGGRHEHGSARARAPHPQCREWPQRRHRHSLRRPGDRPGDSGRHRRDELAR